MRVPFLDLAYFHQRYQSEFADAFQRFLKSGRYIMGPELCAFEQEYADFCGGAYCVGVANGLDALRIALATYDIGAGDEVIVPAHTFIATWLAVSAVGAVVVPVDIDGETGNIDVVQVESAITARTRAIIPVHLYGQLADMAQLQQIAQRHNLLLIEDAAQAHGAKRDGLYPGQLSGVACYSFYPGKNLGALGDAGAIWVSDSVAAKKMAVLRNYGSSTKYIHEQLGFNSRLDEIQAAFLRIKLRDMPALNMQRREQAARYHSVLSKIAEIKLITVPVGSEPVWHLYVIRTQRRDALREWLLNHGVETLVHYPIIPSQQSAYAIYSEKMFPVAEDFSQTCLSLPIGPHLSLEQIDEVADLVCRFFK